MMTKFKAVAAAMMCAVCASLGAAPKGIPMNAKAGYLDMKWGTTVKEAKKKYEMDALSASEQANFAAEFTESVQFYWLVIPGDKEVKMSLVAFYKDKLFHAREVMPFGKKIKSEADAVKQAEKRYGSFAERGIKEWAGHAGCYRDAVKNADGTLSDYYIQVQIHTDKKNISSGLWDCNVYMTINKSAIARNAKQDSIAATSSSSASNAAGTSNVPASAPVAASAPAAPPPLEIAWVVSKKSAPDGCMVYTFCTPCAEGTGEFLFVGYEKYDDAKRSRVRVGQHWGNKKDSVQSGSYVWTGDAGSAKPFTFMDRRWSREKGYCNVRGGDWFDFGDAASQKVYRSISDMLFTNKYILVSKAGSGDGLRFNTAKLEEKILASGISRKEITDAINRERL